jgi:hypothetical protein
MEYDNKEYVYFPSFSVNKSTEWQKERDNDIVNFKFLQQLW